MLMKVKTPAIDFFHVELAHREIDQRLVNWGKFCFSSGGSGLNPMFRWVKPSQQWDAIDMVVPIDRSDAIKIAKGVAALPEPHALALNWCYVYKTSPKKGCQMVKTSMQGLERLIRDGRTMLINRKV